MVGLALEAFDRWAIDNEAQANPTPNMVALAKQGIDRFILARARQLSPPTGRYNCHGLTFAARRANVDGPALPVDISDLLEHDGFQRVEGQARVGDVVVYRDLQGNISHSGLVSRIEELASVVYVWSAWGSLGEFEHPVNTSPYGNRSEYWRLR